MYFKKTIECLQKILRELDQVSIYLYKVLSAHFAINILPICCANIRKGCRDSLDVGCCKMSSESYRVNTMFELLDS